MSVAAERLARRADERAAMIERTIVRRGVADSRVLAAMQAVPREAFVRPGNEDRAYSDDALPILAGQTISQPYIVAWMTEQARIGPNDTVLEVGAGSGYAAAVLAHVAGRVCTIERHGKLAREAAERLRLLGYDTVEVRHGDGTQGWPERAPFDAVLVAAAGAAIPGALLAQLKPGGRLIMPVGDTPIRQFLVRWTKTGDNAFQQDRLGGVAFVPLVEGMPDS
jgi:protein-L-isoaspartate(D-aspartate) O-methyltransferase